MPKVGNIFITGSIGNFGDGEECTELVDVVAQVNMQKDAERFDIYINSGGGYVHVGEEICDFIDTLKVPVRTIGVGIVASMATVIFMKGQTRILKPNTEFMIHLPLGGIEGNSEEIAEYSRMMNQVEKELIKSYKEVTGLNEKALKSLMSNETWLTPERAFELGFTTEAPVQQKAVAHFKGFNLKLNTMSKKEGKESLNKEEVQMFKGFFKMIKNIFTDAPKNIIIQDANGVDIDFTEVADGESVQVGDTATIGGEPADGEYTLPNGEVYVFSAGELTEIIPAEEDVPEEMQDLLDQIAQLTNANEELTASVETEKNRADAAEAKVQKAQTEFDKFKKTLEAKFDFSNVKKKKKEEKVNDDKGENKASSMKAKLAEKRAKRNKNK